MLARDHPGRGSERADTGESKEYELVTEEPHEPPGLTVDRRSQHRGIDEIHAVIADEQHRTAREEGSAEIVDS